MKSIRILTALLGLVACSTAQGASLHVEKTQGNLINAIFLDGEGQNSLFNTVKFQATPNGSAIFQELVGGFGFVIRPPGEPKTYINQNLNNDPLDGGLGWSVLGVLRTPNELSFTGGPLGQIITTANEPDGRLFLGNVYLSAGGSGVATVQLSDAQGAVVADLQAPLGVPEPAAVCLVTLSLLGSAPARRRRRFEA
jgi:hypothetical protein